MKLSIVTTLYFSAPYIYEFYERIFRVAHSLAGESFEIVFVNDGSTDDSLEFAMKLHARDARGVVVDLSRNFGHHEAMMTGLSEASGDKIFLIDSDLEEEPDWLTAFNERMNQERGDVVYGIQDRRKGAVFERAMGALYYRLFRVLTGINQPNNIVTARLMSKQYVQALLSYQERELNI